ncbi:LuxR C-terminal-related transcriptional regulator [Micromonospora sp. NPDC003197]
MVEDRIQDGQRSVPLLAAKLAVAALPGEVVVRPRLFQLLDTGVTGPVTLVSAPAGWGKTTLLSAWSRARDGKTPAWLSVESGDTGDRLWAYLRAALTIDGPGDRAAGSGPDGRPGFLEHLAAALAERAEPTILVIDDFHRIDEPTVLDDLEFLLRHTGDRLRLVLGGRRAPTLALHRRRLSGELTEIGATELAFTAEETTELLAAHEVTLAARQVYDLRARTEGWPAGLRIAARSLRGHPDPARFVAGFSGDHPDVAGYLTEEVLAALPDRERDVLRRIAITDQVSGDLLDALTGESDGDRVLAELHQRIGFVVALGTRPPSYRCHRMLAELLRSELRRWPADRVLDLHRRAATWQVAHARPEAALRHALAAGDRTQAVDLVLGHWTELLPYGPAEPNPPSVVPEVSVAPAASVVSARSGVPGGSVAPARSGVPAGSPIGASAASGDPELALAYAAEHLSRHDPAARDWLRLAVADEGLRVGEQGDRFAVPVAALQLAVARLTGEPTDVRPAADRLLALAPPAGPAAGQPPADLALRAIAHATLGTTLLGAGDLPAAEAELTVGLADAEPAGLPRAARACAAGLALVHAVQGRLREAEDAARMALEPTPQSGGATFSPAEPLPHGPHPGDCAAAHLALAVVALERNHPADADSQLAMAGQWPGEGGDPALAALAALVRAQLLRARGELAGAQRILRAGREELADLPGSPELTHWLLAAEADLHTAHGDTHAARKLLLPLVNRATSALNGDASPVSSETPLVDGGTPAVEALAVALARSYLADGDPAAASRALPAWTDPAAHHWPVPVRLAAGLLDALIAARLSDGRRAARTLEQVLALAEPEGFRWIFVHAEPSTRDLLAAHLDTGTAYWPTISELVVAQEPPSSGAAARPRILGEPLTERELTILRYLQSILSNVEIASELSLSVNTVKTHIRNIYRKLDTSRRREAVRRARELRLL